MYLPIDLDQENEWIQDTAVNSFVTLENQIKAIRPFKYFQG